MTKDLENTLAELPSEFGDLVARLKSSAEVSPDPSRSSLLSQRFLFTAFRPLPLAAAASLAAVLLGMAVYLAASPERTSAAAPTLIGPREYVVASCAGLDAALEIVRMQNADGSWQNDFLTRRNAAALKSCPDARAQLAYRKAVRNLRVRGRL